MTPTNDVITTPNVWSAERLFLKSDSDTCSE